MRDVYTRFLKKYMQPGLLLILLFIIVLCITLAATHRTTRITSNASSTQVIALGALIHDTDGWVDASGNAITTYTNQIGISPKIVVVGGGWANSPDLNTSVLDAVYAQGAMPEWTFLSEDDTEGANQPAYSLNNIINGNYDTLIRNFATEAKNYKKVFLMRFDHEYEWELVSVGNAIRESKWQHTS